MPSYNKFKKRTLLVGDYVCIVLSFYLSFLLRNNALAHSDRRVYKMRFSAAIYVSIFYIFDLCNLTTPG